METATVKERPILFSESMVRAILEGRKTVTRRVVKPQPSDEYSPSDFTVERYCPAIEDRDGMQTDGPEIFGAYTDDEGWKCPFGGPGDRLWVRERFRATRPFTGDMDHDYSNWNVSYYADDHPQYRDRDKWKPSIHMPRWASRISLEVTGVRVERVQSITEDDASAEGAMSQLCKVESEPDAMKFRHRHGFINLWEDLNSERGFGWEANPWVWVVSFKRVQP